MAIVASLVLAAAAAAAPPLGIWPQQTGPAASVVDSIEFYLAEPEDSFGIIAVQPLPAPLRAGDPVAVRRLAGVARRLGADGVLLLGELSEDAIPEDVDAALPDAKWFAIAVFVSFDPEEIGDRGSSRPARIVRRNQLHTGGTNAGQRVGRR